MRKLIALFVACLSLVASSFALASEKEDADTIYALREAIEKVLPADWATEVVADRSTGAPAVRVFSKYPLRVKMMYPNLSTADEDKEQSNVVEMHVVARPFISLEQFAELKKRNAEMYSQRNAFMKKLDGISFGSMEPTPVPPSGYEPKDAAERRLVMEYSALWMRTEPVRLPTHYIKNLSFSLNLSEYEFIVDKAKNTEFENIIKAMDTVLTPYEKQG